MHPRVKEVTPNQDYTLSLVFKDGKKALFNLQPYLHYPCFAPLKDPTLFSQAKASHGTVSWGEEIDFDPDCLYLESQQIT